RERRRRQVALVLIRAAQDQSASFFLVEPQHEVGRKLVGSIFVAAEQRNFQAAERGMTGLVQEYVQQRADHRINGSNSRGRRALGYILPDVVDVLVTDRDVFLIGPRIGDAVTVYRLQQQAVRQPQRAQQLADLLQHPVLLEQLVYGLIGRRLRFRVSDVDPVGSELGRNACRARFDLSDSQG